MTVASGTLRRLSRLDTGGHPLLSLYLDLDAHRFPTPAAREAELSSLLSEPDVADADAAQVRELLRDQPDLLRGAKGLAIYSCAEGAVLEAVALPRGVTPMAIVDTMPWLEPLAAMITSENWGVAVVSRRAARLFRGGPRSLVEFATFDDELHGRHAQGGWSQARFQRGIENQVAVHVRHTAERLLRAHRRRSLDHLVVIAADELAPLVVAALDPDLRERLTGQVARDLEHATVQEIIDAVVPVVEAREQARERELVARIEAGLGAGGLAAAGLDEVLATLEQQRVDVLVVAEGTQLEAALCPDCGGLTTGPDGHCLLDGATLTPVNAVEAAIERAERGSAAVTVLQHEGEALRERGSIAALLRW